MRRILRGLGGACFLVAIGFGGMLLMCSRVHYDYRESLRIDGVLIDADTGEPIRDAFVLVCFAPAERVDAAYVAERREQIEEWHREIAEHGPELPYGAYEMRQANAAVTNPAGRFRTHLRVTWSYNSPGCSLNQGASRRDGIRARALHVERDGRGPVVVDAPHGTWTMRDGPGGPWATHDMGVILVPSEP